MKLFKGFEIKWELVFAAFRTTGALLAGNGPIGYLVLDKQSSYLDLILISVAGAVIVFLTSIVQVEPADPTESKSS